MSNAFRITTLPNGARIATSAMPHMKTVAIGLWAAVGGRHETAKQSGIAHFIEHMLFKGTEKRPTPKANSKPSRCFESARCRYSCGSCLSHRRARPSATRPARALAFVTAQFPE